MNRLNTNTRCLPGHQGLFYGQHSPKESRLGSREKEDENTDFFNTINPFLLVAFLQTGQPAKSRFCELDGQKAVIGDLTQSAKTGQSLNDSNGPVKDRGRVKTSKK